MHRHDLHVVRSEIAHWLEQLGRPVMGIVSSYDPVHYAAKVKLDPEFPDPDQPGNVTESGWLPIITHWSGNGWGCYSPPSIGDQVPVIFLENHGGSGFIIGRCFDWPAHVPAAVDSGEYWLLHKSGTFIKLTNDTNLSINVAGNWNVTVDGNATITVNGTLNLTAPQGDVVVDGVSLVNHTHGGVQTGGGDTAAPNKT